MALVLDSQELEEYERERNPDAETFLTPRQAADPAAEEAAAAQQLAPSLFLRKLGSFEGRVALASELNPDSLDLIMPHNLAEIGESMGICLGVAPGMCALVLVGVASTVMGCTVHVSSEPQSMVSLQPTVWSIPVAPPGAGEWVQTPALSLSQFGARYTKISGRQEAGKRAGRRQESRQGGLGRAPLNYQTSTHLVLQARRRHPSRPSEGCCSANTLST